MFVHVGPFRYRIRLVHGYIQHQGEDCFGLCDNLQQQILISDIPPERQRLQVFFHELMHAWWYHFDVDPNDQEAVVDLVGIAMTDFITQALQKLDRTELEHALAPTTALARDRPAANAKAARALTNTTRYSNNVEPEGEPEPTAPTLDCAFTFERAGWRMKLYEPPPPRSDRRAG